MNNLIYGKNAILNILKYKTNIIDTLYFLTHNEKTRVLKDIAEKNKIKTIQIDNIKNQNLTYIKKIYSAILKIKTQKTTTLENILNQKNISILILDRVQDPHNLASCIRTAEAFGLSCVIISNKDSAKTSPLISKASNAASILIPIIKSNNLKNTLKHLKKYNIKIIGLSAKTNDIINETNLKKPIAIIMGSEKDGIKDTLLNECDHIYKIPMLGQLHNINVSVAAGITLSKIK